MTTKHAPATPLPWQQHGYTLYEADKWRDGNNLGGQWVAHTYIHDGDSLPTETMQANASYIAHAANAYPKLVAKVHAACQYMIANPAATRDGESDRVAALKAFGALLRELGEE